MSKSEMIKWLQNLKKDIGQSQHQDLWHYEEMLDEVIGIIEVSEDAISREYMLEVQKKLKGYMPNDKNYELWDKIKNAPSVVPSRAEGKWFIREYEYFTCDQCGEDVESYAESTQEAKTILENGDFPNYCPNCGAKMKGAEE